MRDIVACLRPNATPLEDRPVRRRPSLGTYCDADQRSLKLCIATAVVLHVGVSLGEKHFFNLQPWNRKSLKMSWVGYIGSFRLPSSEQGRYDLIICCLYGVG